MIRSITKLTKKLRNQSLNEIKPDDQSIITQSNYVTTLEDLDDLDLFNETEDEEKDPDIHFSLTVDKNEEELINNYNSKQTHTNFVNNKENIVQVEDYEQTLPQSPTDSKNELSPTRNHTNSPFSGSPKRSTGGEKRKFSRSSVCPYKMKTLKPSPTYHGDSSSDEEMKELYSKHKCSTQHASIIHTGLRGNRKIACITPLDIPRPSIDFEKQQETGKKLFKKQRPRIVKLKTLHSLKSREMMNDMVLFKPINLLSKVPTSSSSGTCFTPTSSILVPVEESVKNGFSF